MKITPLEESLNTSNYSPSYPCYRSKPQSLYFFAIHQLIKQDFEIPSELLKFYLVKSSLKYNYEEMNIYNITDKSCKIYLKGDFRKQFREFCKQKHFSLNRTLLWSGQEIHITLSDLAYKEMKDKQDSFPKSRRSWFENLQQDHPIILFLYERFTEATSIHHNKGFKSNSQDKDARFHIAEAPDCEFTIKKYDFDNNKVLIYELNQNQLIKIAQKPLIESLTYDFQNYQKFCPNFYNRLSDNELEAIKTFSKYDHILILKN